MAPFLLQGRLLQISINGLLRLAGGTLTLTGTRQYSLRGYNACTARRSVTIMLQAMHARQDRQEHSYNAARTARGAR